MAELQDLDTMFDRQTSLLLSTDYRYLDTNTKHTIKLRVSAAETAQQLHL